MYTDELPSQHHLVSWAGNVESGAKILSLERGGWAESPGGKELLPIEGGLHRDSTYRAHVFPEEREAAADGDSLETD